MCKKTSAGPVHPVHAIRTGARVCWWCKAANHSNGGGATGSNGAAAIQDEQENSARTPVPTGARDALANAEVDAKGAVGVAHSAGHFKLEKSKR